MASNAINSTQLACWIPEYQSAKALAALEKDLVIKKTVWSQYQSELKYGDILDIPIIPNLGTASAVNLNTELTLNAQNTTRVQIGVNQWNYAAVGVGYREQMQNRPDYLTEVAAKCVYACAEAVDTYLAALFSSLTAGNVGTQGSALTDDVLLAAVENLNKANASEDDRHLVLDPESVTDLLKIDMAVREDYVARGARENPATGLIGKTRYGGTVWMSNNLKAQNTSYHSAGFYQREAMATIISKDNVVEKQDWWQKFTSVVRAQVMFGAAVSRATAGVCINTRS